MLEAYRHHVAERAALGIPPLPLTAQQTADVIELLKNPPQGEAEFLLDLLPTACRPASMTLPRSRPRTWPRSHWAASRTR
jgi:aconitase B